LDESVVYYSDDSVAKQAEPKKSVIDKIYDSMEKNKTEYVTLQDGSHIKIEPSQAKEIVYAYEELNNIHQEIFENFLQNNIQSHSMIVEFCNQYNL
jgi:hypothetical protein